MKSNREVAQLATDVLTMTLHGPIPMQTVAELAEGVIRLESENAALKEENERLQAQVERLEAEARVAELEAEAERLRDLDRAAFTAVDSPCVPGLRDQRDKAIETLREERRLRRQAEAERDALRKQIENKKASDQ